MTKTEYSEYTAILSTDLATYGSESTQDDHDEITLRLMEMIELQFPGIDTDEQLISKTTGPDSDTCAQIEQWIYDNWLNALN